MIKNYRIKNLKLKTTYQANSLNKKNGAKLRGEIARSKFTNFHIHPSMEIPHWKHDPPSHSELFDWPLTYLAVIKNPYSWYFSYKKYSGMHERTPDSSIAVAMERWNDLNLSYINYRQENGNLHLARYEDFVTSPQEQVKVFADKYKFGFDENNFQEIDFKAGPGLWAEPIEPEDEFNKVNPFKLYHDKLSPEQIKKINSFLDFSILDELHYAKLV